MLQSHLAASTDDSAAPEVARAERLLRRSAAVEEENHAAWLGLGYVMAARGRESDAIEAWRKAGANASWFIQRGLHHQTLEQPTDALKWYERALSIDPDLGDAWYHLGMTYEKLEMDEAAIGAYRSGLRLSGLEEVGVSDFLLRLGLARRRLQDTGRQEALTYLDQAIAMDDFSDDNSRIQAHYVRGEVLLELHRRGDAMNEYRWVISHHSDHYWALARLGFLAWQLDRDEAQAESLLLRAIALDSDQKYAYKVLGRVYQEVGEFAASMEAFQEVLELDPGDLEAREALNQVKDK